MIFIKNKKGVSEIIGYILLIAIVVAISVFVYQWLKSYVPQEALTCPDGISISVPAYKYECTANTLNFTLRNSGTFSIAGYFIHASNSSQEIATIDLTNYYNGTENKGSGGIVFSSGAGGNTLDPEKEKNPSANRFNLSMINPLIALSTLRKIEIIPIRYVEYKGKERIASCGNAKISIPITCN